MEGILNNNLSSSTGDVSQKEYYFSVGPLSPRTSAWDVRLPPLSLRELLYTRKMILELEGLNWTLMWTHKSGTSQTERLTTRIKRELVFKCFSAFNVLTLLITSFIKINSSDSNFQTLIFHPLKIPDLRVIPLFI